MSTPEPDILRTLYLDPIPISVLLIDDEKLIGEAMRVKFKGEKDIRFSYCIDPQKGFELAKAAGPTTILLDLVMPGVDGLDMVRAFKSNPITKDIPLVVLSAREEPNLRKAVFEMGVADYMIKLPEKEELLSRVRTHSRCRILKEERDQALRTLHLAEANRS